MALLTKVICQVAMPMTQWSAITPAMDDQYALWVHDDSRLSVQKE
jgi:hypothetical protein